MYIDVHWNTKAVIDSMGVGVSVFDSELNLTIWNQKYIEIFDKPLNEVYPGVPFRYLLQCEKRRGDFPGDIDRHLAELTRKLQKNETVIAEFRTRSGKVISSTHAPMPGGGWVGTHLDISAQALATERIEHAAMHDVLTGLPNRLQFNARLSEALIRQGETDHSVILMLLDLDRFKQVNDTFGHPVGDELLKLVTDRLGGCIRETDIAARIGGDEFAIVLEAPREKAREVSCGIAKAILHDIQRPFVVSGNPANIGVSIGICVAHEVVCSQDHLIHQADRSLYRAKHGGRNRYDYREFDHTETLVRHGLHRGSVCHESLAHGHRRARKRNTQRR